VEIGKGYVLENCQHPFCKDCLKGYLEEKIQNGLVLDISCPDQNCDKGMGYYDVKLLVDEENFRKYEEFCFVAALKTDPNIKWCTNPKGCQNAVIFDPLSRENKIICTECKYEFCVLCAESWHFGTCEAYQQWKIENSKEDKEFAQWTKDNTKPCPKCKARTQKNKGCNHMTCSSCRYQWCWLCDGKYSDDHYAVYNMIGCPGMQFDGDGKNDSIDMAKAGYRKALGRRVMVGTGMVVGIPVAVPLGIGLVGAAVVIAAPFALIAGGVYGGYKLKKKFT